MTMFQNLRTNGTLYVLHKDGTPRVETATIVSVSVPTPRFPNTQPFGATQDNVVDVVARINGADTTFSKLPATADIADFGTSGNIVLSTSRDAMNGEVAAIKQRALDVIASVDRNREIAAGCDAVLAQLNPEYGERQKRDAEIGELRGKLDALSDNVAQLIAAIGKGTGHGSSGN